MHLCIHTIFLLLFFCDSALANFFIPFFFLLNATFIFVLFLCLWANRNNFNYLFFLKTPVNERSNNSTYIHSTVAIISEYLFYGRFRYILKEEYRDFSSYVSEIVRELLGGMKIVSRGRKQALLHIITSCYFFPCLLY